jgi:hypothetical protein
MPAFAGMTNQYDRKPGLGFSRDAQIPVLLLAVGVLLFFLELSATDLVCSAEILDRQPQRA